jgi:hypothetical protein
MIAFNNWVKFMLTTLVSLFVCGWQVVENKSLVPNLPHKLSKVAQKLNISIKHNDHRNTM